MDPAERRKGTTTPISRAYPTDADLKSTEDLIEELKGQHNFESAAETEKRIKTLQTLQKVTTQFVKEAMTKKKLPTAIVNSAGGKIFTYGSYRLGVYGPGSDIDTIVVAPKDITREDFFELYPPVLERMSPAGAIEELTSVPDAFVPIIKIEYSGISIDLIFASLAMPSIPLNLDLKDKSVLKGLDERTMRSINGPRVTDEILDLVPQPKTFRTALRAIKLWAQRRAIYANVMGFPGGVAWAMLVARTCQLYPNATSSVIVNKFFRIILNWNWPQPVLLKDIESGPHRVWNPQHYYGDSFHLMPIITPAYPSMCATHNITLSTKQVCLKEVARAGDIADKIFVGRLKWSALFDKHTFFTQDYKYYLSVVSCSRTKEAQLLWSGLVESKVRLLVADLDNDDLIKVAHPFNKGFERVHHCRNEDEIAAVMHGDLRYQAKNIETETTDSTNNPIHNAAAEGGADNISMPNGNAQNDNSNVSTLYTTTYYIGLQLAELAKKLDISWATNKFKDLCTQWPRYESESNYLHVIHCRNFDLPDDVFSPDETKPARAAKKKAVKKQSPDTNKKRKHETDDSGLTEGQTPGKRHAADNGVAAAT